MTEGVAYGPTGATCTCGSSGLLVGVDTEPARPRAAHGGWRIRASARNPGNQGSLQRGFIFLPFYKLSISLFFKIFVSF